MKRIPHAAGMLALILVACVGIYCVVYAARGVREDAWRLDAPQAAASDGVPAQWITVSCNRSFTVTDAAGRTCRVDPAGRITGELPVLANRVRTSAETKYIVDLRFEKSASYTVNFRRQSGSLEAALPQDGAGVCTVEGGFLGKVTLRPSSGVTLRGGKLFGKFYHVSWHHPDNYDIIFLSGRVRGEETLTFAPEGTSMTFQGSAADWTFRMFNGVYWCEKTIALPETGANVAFQDGNFALQSS